MRRIELGAISGIHPHFAGVERELDLAPIDLPDPALVPKALAMQISELYPLVVTGPDLFCVGQTALYRWLTIFMPPSTPVCCIDLSRDFRRAPIEQIVFAERLVIPSLARITPQQVHDFYQHISSTPTRWANEYRSHAHLARLVGVKPLKGTGREI